MSPVRLIRVPGTVVLAAGGGVMEWVLWSRDTTTRWGGEMPLVALVFLVCITLAGPILAWWRPLLGAASSAAVTGMLAWVLPSWESFAGVLLCLHILARKLPLAPACAGLAVCAAPFAITSWNSVDWAGRATLGNWVLVFAFWLALSVAVWGTGRFVRRSRSQISNLQASLQLAEQQTRLRERRSIARDLHDIVAHAVAGIVLQAGGAKALAQKLPPGGQDQARITEALSTIEDMGQQAMRELHRLVSAMRAGEDDALSPAAERMVGLAFVDGLVANTRASGLDVTVETIGDPVPLDPSVDVAAYRCLQEVMSNAMKHSGVGSTLAIRMIWGQDLILDTLSTPAAGAPRPSVAATAGGGHGLVGLSERLASVGGSYQAQDGDDGFRLVATIPLRG